MSRALQNFLSAFKTDANKEPDMSSKTIWNVSSEQEISTMKEEQKLNTT